MIAFCGTSARALPLGDKQQDSLDLYTDFLYLEEKNIYQDFYFTAEEEYNFRLEMNCFSYKNETDSIRIYSTTVAQQQVKKGNGKFTVPFQKTTNDVYILPSFAHVLHKTGLIPPGNYKIFLKISDGSYTQQQVFVRETDSLLPYNTGIRKGINQIIAPVKKGFFQTAPVKPGYLDKASNALNRYQFRMDKYFRKNGLTPLRYTRDGKEIIDLYCEEWFMGRYEMNSDVSLTDQLKKEEASLEHNIGGMARNQLNNYQSLLSQFRELKKNSKENKELIGEIAVSGNFSNDREQYSAEDNNYYELRGGLELPVFDIPVSVSGYYTTQDKNRQAKASFIHFRYDVEKAKEQLLKLIGSYNKRYEQTIASGGNYELIYGQFVQQLNQEKTKAIATLKQETGLAAFDPASFDPEILKTKARELAGQQIEQAQDSVGGVLKSSEAGRSIERKAAQVQKTRQSAEEIYAKAMKQYNRIIELEQKMKKYQTLLQQYKKTLQFDSLMAYDKIKDLKNVENMSYKDMVKKASGILPEGKAKSAVAGLTNLDAGMFPKYISDYTMSGQMLKGVDIGYDIGIATIGATYGKTEYIDRNGNVEGYKAYSGRILFKPLFHQSFGLVYYGYSPGRQLLSDDNFFKGTDISLPSFRNPVHIVSATYEGQLSQYAALSGTYAFSKQQGQSAAAADKVVFKDKSAYNINLEGTVPGLPVTVEAGYEFTGKAFENNTLPVVMAGTEKFRIKGKGDLFQSFLTIGVEYNYLLQRSFYTKGNNSRWGFDLSTHSKRYPSVYLSYKPFSTFRSFNDTLSIEQKPILGEVWTGRLNYQIKKRDKAIRFVLLYNKNTSTMDTLQYGSSLLQFTTMLSRKATMLSINIGANNIQASYIQTAFPAFNSSKFINVTAGTSLAQINVNGGLDLAASNIGLSRYGAFTGIAYTFRRLPFMIRTNFRFNNYRLEEGMGWKQLYSGGIELAWRFKVKLFDTK